MDKRSWPWKKKSSFKHAHDGPDGFPASAGASPVHRSSKREDHAAIVKSYVDQLQEAQEKIGSLSSKLAAAEREIAEKENLVKQHSKVAEDAVSGWEKAENETANTKQELEVVLEQKAELVEQASYLDETLKEAMANQKKMKEESERKLQEVTSRKAMEMERLRLEFDNRLADLGQRLLESSAENKVLSSTLQERTRTISELRDAMSRAEAEIGALNLRLESKEKDIMALRYEVQVLNKELQIRNEEKDYCKREADVAHRQQQEGLKRIQVLETECQRLRALVRRKLPGPAAMAQMKQEVDSWGREERRRSLGSKGDNGRLSGGSKDFQIQLLTERVLSMEEETKMLREVLAQRNCELQATRSVISEAAATPVRGPTKSRTGAAGSECSLNDDTGSCADVWSSISELDTFKKEKSNGSPGLLADDSKFQMMDDFAEMEQLASSASKEKQKPTGETGEQRSPAELLKEKEKELSAANRLCVEISSKLLETEKEYAALKEKNAANELSLIKLQEKIDSMVDHPAEGVNVMDEKKSVKSSALSANVQKVICLVESLAHAIGVEHDDSSCLPSPSNSESSSSEHSTTGSLWQQGAGFEKLTSVSNQLAEGKVGFTDFMDELSAVLNLMTSSISSSDNGSEHGRRPSSFWRKESSYANGGAEELTKVQKENKLLHVEVAKLRQELHRLKVEKDMLHQSCEGSGEKVQTLQAELSKAEAVVTEMRTNVQCLEGEVASLRGELEKQVKTSEATIAGLREKLLRVEEQYGSEREQHQALAVKYQELENEINRKQELLENGHGTGAGADACANNGEDIAVKLAECQRTILALGKQLKVLSSPRTSHSREDSTASSLDNNNNSSSSNNNNNNNRCSLEDEESELSNDYWSSQRAQQSVGLGQPPLSWSPPRKLEQMQKQQDEDDAAEASWLYSPERHPVIQQQRQPRGSRSPGRFLAANKRSTAGISDLSRSVNIPSSRNSSSNNSNSNSSFSRFFSRGRNAA